MLINRLSGLVLPASSKYLIDDVLTKGRTELLMPIALVTGAATVVQAITSYALSQVLGIAAQAAITEMRRAVHEHITHLPVRYFDKTQSGVLISRVMSDAEGIRNLVGTGLVQLTGSVVTAVLSLVVLFYLNWHLTLITLLILGAFGGVMGFAFKKLRPLFRERGKINAEVTGRLTQALGGIRVVKAYTAEKREQIVFAQGVHKLLRNVTQSMTGVSMTTALSTVIVGIIGVVMIIDRRQRHPRQDDDHRRLRHVPVLHRHDGRAGRADGVDRHANHRGVRRPRSHPRGQADAGRRRRGRRRRRRSTRCAARWRSTRCGSSTTRACRC